MRNRTLVVLLVVALMVVVSGSALAAGSVVRYADTSSDTSLETEGSRTSNPLQNGHFSLWDSNGPVGWTILNPSAQGWETAHLSNMNMAAIGDTVAGIPINDALAFFVRNVGGSGPYYAYASQQLATSGDFWFQIHGTMFGEYPWLPTSLGQFVGTDAVANAMAWYAISDSADPVSVPASEWRELFSASTWGFDRPGMLPCYNGVQFCDQTARYETVHINEGQYLHLRAGHKWDTFNVWTVFEFDDISMTPLDSAVTKDYSGRTAVGDVYWDEHGIR